MVRIKLYALVALVFASILLGCDQYPGRMAITGTVTLHGTPLKNGTITFYPTSTTTQAGTEIVDGNFSIKREQGLLVGKYRVAISSPDGATPVDPNVPPGPSGNFASKERIPAAYNQESKLEAEVTSAGPNHFEFKIP